MLKKHPESKSIYKEANNAVCNSAFQHLKSAMKIVKTPHTKKSSPFNSQPTGCRQAVPSSIHPGSAASLRCCCLLPAFYHIISDVTSIQHLKFLHGSDKLLNIAGLKNNNEKTPPVDQLCEAHTHCQMKISSYSQY